MTRLVNSLALDATLDYIINNTDRQVAVSGDPANYAAVAGMTLAVTTMTGGDFSKSDGPVDGRRLTVAAKTGITPSATGTAVHIVLVDDTNLDILLQIPVPDTALTSGVGTNFGSWEYVLRGASAPQ